MLHHRIKDIMIANAVLALVLAAAIALNSFAAVVFIGIVTLLTIVLPIVLVERYLYRHQRGTWYLWKHPVKPRSRCVAPTYPLPYPRVLPFEDEAWAGSAPHRTRLFQSGDPAEPVSRVSLLLKVAGRLESTGRPGAAARIYQQVIETAPGRAESLDATDRLRSLGERHDRRGRTPSDR